uniref:30S ribosomal protein S4, chloroplastic n=1 Tax=Lygus hesperus TaxID=30085 RepID=A0A0A9Y8K0_LYGHE
MSRCSCSEKWRKYERCTVYISTPVCCSWYRRSYIPTTVSISIYSSFFITISRYCSSFVVSVPLPALLSASRGGVGRNIIDVFYISSVPWKFPYTVTSSTESQWNRRSVLPSFSPPRWYSNSVAILSNFSVCRCQRHPRCVLYADMVRRSSSAPYPFATLVVHVDSVLVCGDFVSTASSFTYSTPCGSGSLYPIVGFDSISNCSTGNCGTSVRCNPSDYPHSINSFSDASNDGVSSYAFHSCDLSSTAQCTNVRWTSSQLEYLKLFSYRFQKAGQKKKHSSNISCISCGTSFDTTYSCTVLHAPLSTYYSIQLCKLRTRLCLCNFASCRIGCYCNCDCNCG